MSAGYDSETASEEDPVVLTPQVKRKSQEIVVVESSDTESDEDLAKVKRYCGSYYNFLIQALRFPTQTHQRSTSVKAT
jgi:hypothetical protein